MQQRIVILSPTENEISVFKQMWMSGEIPMVCAVDTCGVGMAETAAAAIKSIMQYSPMVIILAGIAGAYPASGISVGDTVIVDNERVADLGAWRGDNFQPLFVKNYSCGFAEEFRSLKKTTGNTVNTAAVSYIPDTQAGIENMEGASFFAVCSMLNIPFLEIRSISNIVGDHPWRWDIPTAAINLAQALRKVTDEIGKMIGK